MQIFKTILDPLKINSAVTWTVVKSKRKNILNHRITNKMSSKSIPINSNIIYRT